MTGQDASYGPLSSLNGFDLPAQSLAQLQGAGLARPVMPFPRGLLSSQSSTSQTMLPNREKQSVVTYKLHQPFSSSSLAFNIFQQELPVNSFPLASAPGLSARKPHFSSSISRTDDHGRNQTQPSMVPRRQAYGNGGGSSARVKSERVAFHEQYSNQEHLMSAELEHTNLVLIQEGVAPVDTEFDFDAYSIDDIPV
ncbi:unnamed protein product [Brassica oleracea var. botrytis]